MEDSFIATLKSTLTIQRWNLQPKVETWVEAENAMVVAHFAYGIAKGQQISDDQITHLLFRILLKSLNKHYTTDISHFVTDELRNNYKSIWEKVIDNYANQVSKLLPREISSFIKNYLVYQATYGENIEFGFPKLEVKDRARFEDIILFCQNRAAIQEFEINAKIYNGYYREVEEQTNKLDSMFLKYQKIMNDNKEYFQAITRLKYIRRWNNTNRFMSSSVLGHTYVVSVLTLILSLAEKKDVNFIRDALLKAMFHDVPESMTGDIITPVKEELKRHNPNLVSEIEKKLTKEKFTDKAPQGIQNIINRHKLFEELSNDVINSESSLVKDCDQLALMVECLSEKEAKVEICEMEKTYLKYYQKLSNSEWPKVREFLGTLDGRWLNAQLK